MTSHKACDIDGHTVFKRLHGKAPNDPVMELTMNIIQTLEQEEADRLTKERAIPDFRPGDTLLVKVKVVEGDRTRIQAYEGVCIARAGRGIHENFTVRKISYGEGVERIFPTHSPMIDEIKIVRRGEVRRAKLYYLRELRGKKARITERQDQNKTAKDVEADAAE